MATNSTVSHIGRIVDITPEFITVEIVSESACSSCHAASLCGLSESRVKQVQVPSSIGCWEIGQEVQVLLRRTMGLKAVWVAYAAPLLILVAVLLLTGLIPGFSELASGLSAIAAVAVYYLLIYLLRNKLRNEWTFSIKEK